ncbi:unnamed protein product, partial [marine sediment metagenome]
MGNEIYNCGNVLYGAMDLESAPESVFVDEYYHSNLQSMRIGCENGSSLVQAKMYNCRLGMQEIKQERFNVPGSYVVSRKHNGVAGASKIWGDYNADEDLKFNYAEGSYGARSTFVAGSGNTGDGTLTVTSTPDATTQTRYWEVECIGTAANGGTFSVRYIASGSSGGFVYAVPGTFSFGAFGGSYVYNEVGTNLQFLIANGGVGYEPGDMFRFSTIAQSNDANVQKDVKFGWSNCAGSGGRSRLTIPVGRVLELKGGVG